MDVALANGARSVRLVKGRVRLAVARQEVPLHIEAGQGRAMANDAEIEPSIDEAGTATTTLRRGRGELRMGAQAAPATERNSVGEGKSVSRRDRFGWRREI